MTSWLRRLLSKKAREQYHHDQTVRRYRQFATRLGESLSYANVCAEMAFGFDGVLWTVREHGTYHQLYELEVAYSSLGYRIIPLQDWIDHGAWGVGIDSLWLVNREKDERPQFTKFDINDLPKASPIVGIVMETGKPVIGVTNEDGEMAYRIIDN